VTGGIAVRFTHRLVSIHHVFYVVGRKESLITLGKAVALKMPPQIKLLVATLLAV
jgi:hypothetical protein